MAHNSLMYETVEIPIQTLPDGRKFIAVFDARERSDMEDFVRQFSNYWKWDQRLYGFVGPVEAD